MRKLTISISVFLILSFGFSGPVNAQAGKIFLVGFYNVENLFDNSDDPGTADEAFTPSGAMQWDRARYRKKLEDLARVISGLDSAQLPALLGLCEVENRKVLVDLVNESSLKPGGYGMVHYDSPDERGIDVALLYQSAVFRVVEDRSIPVVFPFDTTNTRDILYVKGIVADADTLHVFVNHWSSRREGQRQTERRRIFSAVALRRAVDSVMNYHSAAKILIMGDFNDEPTNLSLHSALNSNNKRFNASPRELYNLMYDLHNVEQTGTYNFRGRWNMLDQIHVSRSLLDASKGLKADYEGGKIYRQDWMMFSHPEYGPTPNRTYGGTEYYGGTSDHLPVYTLLKIIQ